MNNQHKRFRFLGLGLTVLAVGFAASARPAAAQPPLLSHPTQVQPIFGDRDHNNDRDHWRAEQTRRNAERIRHETEVRREAERARHEAEQRRIQWLKDHRHDRDDSHHDWRHDHH